MLLNWSSSKSPSTENVCSLLLLHLGKSIVVLYAFNYIWWGSLNNRVSLVDVSCKLGVLRFIQIPMTTNTSGRHFIFIYILAIPCVSSVSRPAPSPTLRPLELRLKRSKRVLPVLLKIKAEERRERGRERQSLNPRRKQTPGSWS